VNDEDKKLTSVIPAISGGIAVARQGIHAKYDVERVSFPMSLLNNGPNRITLVAGSTNEFTTSCMIT